MIYRDSSQHTVLVVRMVPKYTTFIAAIKGQRKIRTMPTAVFKSKFIKVDKPPAEVADIWLKSTIKLTERVKKELIMAKKGKVAEECIGGEETEECFEVSSKKRNSAKKRGRQVCLCFS